MLRDTCKSYMWIIGNFLQTGLIVGNFCPLNFILYKKIKAPIMTKRLANAL
jgi:hypothetical protein